MPRIDWRWVMCLGLQLCGDLRSLLPLRAQLRLPVHHFALQPPQLAVQQVDFCLQALAR
jgi:hypothetical protein